MQLLVSFCLGFRMVIYCLWSNNISTLLFDLESRWEPSLGLQCHLTSKYQCPAMALVDALPCLPLGIIYLINMTRAVICLSSSSCICIPVFFATHCLFIFLFLYLICDIIALKFYLARINSNISGGLFSYQFFFH